MMEIIKIFIYVCKILIKLILEYPEYTKVYKTLYRDINVENGWFEMLVNYLVVGSYVF